MKKLMMGVTGMLALAAALLYNTANVKAGQDDKITICHADGRADTIKFSEITVSPTAAANHLDLITGTPQAGHELDTLGPCVKK